MKTRSEKADIQKKVSLSILFLISVLIILSGSFLSVYFYLGKVSFTVLNFDIPGAVFGLAAVFLGIRYFISCVRLKRNLNGVKTGFRLSNFKITKKLKAKGNI